MKTLISEIILKKLPEEYIDGVHDALQEYVENVIDTRCSSYSLNNAMYEIENAKSIHDIVACIERWMKSDHATAWNMLDIFTEFRKMLDKCNDLVPKGIIKIKEDE